ncbi:MULTISPECIES: pectinesterase family protein [unclassified Wenzhouxiangella]|uniref:pectinesterase family protein n=1 Tax=unclassified Wenzhouxiangella TaxID=2613841 RepID=UPI000E328BDA|nr:MULTISPECIES: pectinesterase family protein [unclassified Wenzhouxiangella]RFF26820.1 hypothetical protein DZK25_11105 [Wenzhouxiangella sp. 15181]RFP69062.1 hypothetical protein DZK26_05520 [Wenzhouxiangella sp. 15190]
MKHLVRALLIAAVIGSGQVVASTTFTYQGQLQNNSGPVNDTVVMEFHLYDTEGATTPLDSDDPRAITVTDGLFQAELDFGQQPWGDGLWLEIIIDDDTTLPRQRLTGVPLALGVAAGSISNSEIAVGAVGNTEIDSNEVQRRVDGVCATGSAIAGIKQDGTVDCEPMSDAPNPDNVVVVATSGGDFTDVQSAIDSIDDASATNPYVVQVGPGTFDGRVKLIDHVHLVGWGRGATTLTATGAETRNEAFTVDMTGVTGVELRDLTVVNTGGDEAACGIDMYGVDESVRVVDAAVVVTDGATFHRGVKLPSLSSPSLERVEIHLEGAPSSQNYGISASSSSAPRLVDVDITVITTTNETFNAYGIYNLDDDSVVNRVTVDVSGPTSGGSTGIWVSSNDPTILHTHISVTGSEDDNHGISTYGGSPKIRRSTIESDGVSVYGVQSSPTPSSPTIAHSELIGVVDAAQPKCYAVHDADLNELGPDCSAP